MVEPSNRGLSVRRQCELLGLNRSTYYYQPCGESTENLALMRRLDELHMERPCFGSRMLSKYLGIGRERTRRLMRQMGIEAIYPKPRTTQRNQEHKVFPYYLLRDLRIERCDQVWSTDITYVPMDHGFMYLTAVIDWYSRYVISWRISNSLDGHFCREALEEALSGSRQPEIFNTDQGCQYTSVAFTSLLQDHGIRISMDGRGRALDNVFIERLWRTVKYEHIYLWDYTTPWQLETGLEEYFGFYCHRRLHSSLNYRTPAAVYYAEPTEAPSLAG
jgi:putative transposase